MKKNKKQKSKRHIKLKPFLFFLIFLFFIVFLFYSFFTMRIKNVVIIGTTILKDKEIMEIANLKEYPRLWQYSSKNIEKNIASLPFIQSVHVKKSVFGTITIKIEEAHVLFYNRNSGSYVLSNSNEIVEGEYAGTPFLINYVPKTIYERLIKEMSHISKEAISLISEMEYSPSKSGETILDDTRFLLRMNDGNQVYINLINIDRLDMYALIYTGLEGKGILEMDSDNENVWFH